MSRFEIIVTDVTNYGSALYCVAGWEIAAGRMIRPEPANSDPRIESSRFWDRTVVGPNSPFWPGHVVRFEATDPPGSFAFPHATEDRIVTSGVEWIGTDQSPLNALGPSVSANLPAAYDGGLVRAASTKAYVPANYRGRSLGAIELQPNFVQMRTDENPFSGKRTLRATVTSGGVSYDLSVTSSDARTLWQQAGAQAIQDRVAASRLVHLRVGLSRPFAARPNECYSQVNGLIFVD